MWDAGREVILFLGQNVFICSELQQSKFKVMKKASMKSSRTRKSKIVADVMGDVAKQASGKNNLSWLRIWLKRSQT